jgi:S1-C subfamily serine protease
MKTISTLRGRVPAAILRFLPACALGMVLHVAAGTVFAGVATIPDIEQKVPTPYVAEQPGRPAFLRQIKTRFEAPGVVGELQNGWFCTRRGDIVWNQATQNLLLPTQALTSRFRKELEAAGYPVPVISDAVFEEKKEPTDKVAPGPLQVGIFIKEVAVNLCSKGANEWLGAVYVKLNWQVFAPELQKVVFEITTEGNYKAETEQVKGSASVLGLNAFAMASRNFLAAPGFLKAVTTPVVQGAAIPGDRSKAGPDGADRLQITGVAGTDEPLSQKITRVRAGVATVFGDSGSGTGFFISSNGMLLTNQHVVGKTKFVKVRLTTGRELVGEVMRSDATRDVALIKTEQVGLPPLPVRLVDAAIGEDVFALGSPLGDTFNTTLTKGIVSGMRELGSQPFLQSDVAILPGNSGGPLLDRSGQVIAITVMGLGAKGMAGMNFFIPIGDALTKLGVQFVPGKPAPQ